MDVPANGSLFGARPARPWLAWSGDAIAVLALGPLAVSLGQSFLSPSGVWGAYRLIWVQGSGPSALATTLKLSALAASLALPLGLALAGLACRLGSGRAILTCLLACLPVLLPSSLLASAWIVALGAQGVLTPGLHRLVGSWTIFTPSGAAMVLALRYFGVAGLLLAAAQWPEQSDWPTRQILLASRAAGFVHLHLRRLVPAMAGAWLLVMLLCVNDHVIPDMLLVSTYGSQVLILSSAMMDNAGAAALAAPFGLLGLGLAVAAVRLSRPMRSGDAALAGPRRPGRGTVCLCLAGLAGLLGLALGVPLAVLAHRVPNLAALTDALVLARPQALQTLNVAIASALICTLCAAIAAGAWLESSRRAPGRSLVPLLLVGFIVPPSLIGIGTIAIFGQYPASLVRDTLWPLVTGCVIRYLPLAMLILYALWKDEDALPALVARAHGVSAWRRLRHIHWPARRLGLLGVFVLCALLTATDLDVSLLLAPAGGSTLGVRLATLIHTGSDAIVASLALDILGLIAPAIVALFVIASLQRRTRP